MMLRTLHEHAIRYRQLGWNVFPLSPSTKIAAIKWADLQKELATGEQVAKWFPPSTAKNIGVVLGEISKLVCRDFDDEEAYEVWRAEYPDLAKQLPTVQTARGKHVYAVVDAFPQSQKYRDGEFRGNGNYTVLPPSVHPSGKLYQWIIPPQPKLLRIHPVFSLGFCHVTEEGQKRTEESQKNTEVHGRGQKPTDVRQKSTEAIVSWEDITNKSELIGGCLPTEPGQRERCLFQLARRLLATCGPLENREDELLIVFDLWWELARHVVATKDYETSMNAFLRACEGVHTPLDDYLNIAKSSALRTEPPVWARRFSPECQFLAGICRELQLLNGAEPFFLSCHTAEKLVGVPHQTTNRWLQLFVRLKRLRVIVPGTQGRNGKATRYRYVSND